MQSEILVDWAILTLICAIVAVGTVYVLTPQRKLAGKFAGAGLLGHNDARDPVFLFDDQQLIGASSGAWTLVNDGPPQTDWDVLRQELAKRFPGFPQSQDDIQGHGSLVVPAGGSADSGNVLCEWVDGITRVHLRGQAGRNAPTAAVSQETEMLQNAMGQAPYPVWHIDTSGTVSWCNAAYRALCQKALGELPDPTPSLFSFAPEKGTPGKKTRSSVAATGSNKKLWYDVSTVALDTGHLYYAVDINAVVDAEIAQRNFVQTLAKTFAQLSIGLAIFDRNRQLALFNPALIDLTTLPADFLSARPNLLSFFDRLRDQKMMPEPKNYGSWRNQMADLVAAAADGRYQETWSLPSGSVYSVSGRPHPDGAVAFLFEDITAEITLTRRFRSDLEMDQAILDRLDDAIAVFSESGGLVFSNASYRSMWEVDPDNSFAQMSVLDATRSWQDGCQATPVLGEIRDFVATRENRADWWSRISLKSGQDLICNVYPIQNGATMVSFARTSSELAALGVDTGIPVLEHSPNG
ncbi:MAG: PAS domain-containing protein [Paracoccaceae bacterium]|jgi:PAS domain-containing protein